VLIRLGALVGSADLRFMKRMLSVAPDSALVLIGSDFLPARWLLSSSAAPVPLRHSSPRWEGGDDGDDEDAAGGCGLVDPGFHIVPLASGQAEQFLSYLRRRRSNPQAPFLPKYERLL
jgi:hypothetical protein